MLPFHLSHHVHRLILATGIAVAVLVAGFIAYQQINRPQYALEVDATKDVTDVGIQYRIRMTNIGTEQLTGIVVELGAYDIQNKTYLDPGQSYYFYPDPETEVSTVKVKTNEGIEIESGYRSPTKVIGLPGAGR